MAGKWRRDRIPELQDFATRLKYAIKRQGSQLACASYCGVSEACVAYWCTGRSEPKFRHLLLLSEYTRMSLDELVGTKYAVLNKLSEQLEDVQTCLQNYSSQASGVPPISKSVLLR